MLRAAAAALAATFSPLRLSSFYETEPVGVGPQPTFLNAAAIGEASGTARETLETLLDLENRFGRARPHPGAARTLDLDLILFGAERLDTPELMVPHPRFRDRLFVLEPLAEIAPGWVDPVTSLTVVELLADWRARHP